MQSTLDAFLRRAPAAKKAEELKTSPIQKKRKAVIISSDEEDEVPRTSKPDKSRANKKLRTEEVTDKVTSKIKPNLSKLQSSNISNNNNNSNGTKLKSVNPAELFGGETVRVAATKAPKPKDIAIVELEDDEIDNSLLEVDLDASRTDIKKNYDVNAPKTAHKKSPRDKTKSKLEKVIQQNPNKNQESKTGNEKTETVNHIKKEKSPNEHEHKQKAKEKQLPKNEVKKPETKKERSHNNPDATTPKKKIKKDPDEHKQQTHEITAKTGHKNEQTTPKVKKATDDLNTSVLSDEERFERRRMAYQSYIHRPSCINHGSKEVPKGKPNCLAGLSFKVTGVLESLQREECEAIVKEYGGKIMTTVGKRLNYLIVGEEAGAAKLEKAEAFHIKIISEDEFFDLIRSKSSETDAEQSEKPITKIQKSKTTPKKAKLEAETKPEKPVKVDKIIKNEQLEDNEQFEQKQSQSENKDEAEEKLLSWVDKYKPKAVNEIIGQQGAASNVAKLTNWLTNWYSNHDGKKKLSKPSPWAKNDDGSYYKAALLSGPPGVGKTTTATLVCKKLGFDLVEFNASDTRSKRQLKEQVSELLSNKSLYGYVHGKSQAVTKKHVLIMDEVDGMAGNEDRGGIQELIALIKDSSVPIICMCNDRNHQKMRSLVNYCYDLRFNKPMLKQIKGHIMGICFKEKLNLDSNKIDEIITATNNDIRQTINHLALLSAGNQLDLKPNSAEKNAQATAQKDLKMGPWDVVRKVFSAEEHKRMSFNDKCDLFFHDYSLGPLFVQQNYLQVLPSGPKSEVMQKVALAADALSLGDLVDKRIRANSAWSLLPTQAVFSSVMPGAYMSCHFTGQINFPGWLGKNSRANKRSRLAQEIQDHTRLRTTASRQSIRLDYAPFLLQSIVRPLKEHGTEGVEDALNVLKEYHLLREDIESLIELSTWPGMKNIMDSVEGRVKAALTRAYNKEALAYSYSATAGVKKKRAEAADAGDLMDLEDGDGNDDIAAFASDEEHDDDLENDGLIKTKKKETSSSAKSSGTSKTKAAGTSKKAAASNAKTTTKSSSSTKSKK